MWGKHGVRSAGSKPLEPPPLRSCPLRPQHFAAGTVPTHGTEGLEGHGMGKGNILVLFGNTKEMALRATERPKTLPRRGAGLEESVVFPPALLPSWDSRSPGYRGRHILLINGIIISLPLLVPASLCPLHPLSARGCLLVKSSLAAALYSLAASYGVTLGCCAVRGMCWVVRNLYKRIKT